MKTEFGGLSQEQYTLALIRGKSFQAVIGRKDIVVFSKYQQVALIISLRQEVSLEEAIHQMQALRERTKVPGVELLFKAYTEEALKIKTISDVRDVNFFGEFIV